MNTKSTLRSVLVAVPTTGGIMKSKTAESLFRLAKVLTVNGINAGIRNVNEADVVRVRNIYANTVLNSDQWDGLLFIDSDMQFEPKVVMKMLTFNQEAAAVAYPKKNIDLDRFVNAVRHHGDIAKARAQSSDFNILPTWDNRKTSSMRRRGGFCSMAAAGMGCSLIARSALRAMVDGGVVPKRVDVRDSVETTSWGFFDQITMGQIVLGEDFSFWYRWTEMLGRELWVCVDEEISHLGDFEYSGDYSLLLRGGPRK